MPSKEERKSLTTKESIWKKLRLVSIKRGLQMRDIVDEALTNWLMKKNESK